MATDPAPRSPAPMPLLPRALTPFRALMGTLAAAALVTLPHQAARLLACEGACFAPMSVMLGGK